MSDVDVSVSTINLLLVACSMGTFYNSTSQNCEFCPVGTYGSTTGLRKCTICGSGKTTLGVGYTARSDCVGMFLINKQFILPCRVMIFLTQILTLYFVSIVRTTLCISP